MTTKVLISICRRDSEEADFQDGCSGRLTTPSSATPGRGRGCEHAGARRRRGLCRASWRAAQPVTEPVGPPPRSVTERQREREGVGEGKGVEGGGCGTFARKESVSLV